MNRINDLIRQKCTNNVKYTTIDDVIKSYSSGLNPRQNFKLNEPDAELYYVTVKEITSGKIVFSDKTDRINFDAWNKIQNRSKLEINDILLSGIGTIGKVALVDIPVDNWNCSESVILLKPKTDIIIPKYLVHLLRSDSVQKQWINQSVGSTLKGLRKENVLKTKIALPPIEIQNEIVEILDKFDELNKELDAELIERKKQYNYYQKQLLYNDKFQKKRLDEIAYFSQGIQVSPEEQYDICSEGMVPFLRIVDFVKNDEPPRYIYKPDDKYMKLENDEMVMIRYGAAAAGKVFINKYGAIANNMFKINVTDEQVNIKYLWHFLSQERIYDKLNSNASGSTMPAINFKLAGSIEIFIPDMEEQKRIINILDKFEALTNDAEIGLPAEIDLRRKQYEYYRNKLLSFEELSVNE